jgi:hypothetical protein
MQALMPSPLLARPLAGARPVALARSRVVRAAPWPVHAAPPLSRVVLRAPRRAAPRAPALLLRGVRQLRAAGEDEAAAVTETPAAAAATCVRCVRVLCPHAPPLRTHSRVTCAPSQRAGGACGRCCCGGRRAGGACGCGARASGSGGARSSAAAATDCCVSGRAAGAAGRARAAGTQPVGRQRRQLRALLQKRNLRHALHVRTTPPRFAARAASAQFVVRVPARVRASAPPPRLLAPARALSTRTRRARRAPRAASGRQPGPLPPRHTHLVCCR